MIIGYSIHAFIQNYFWYVFDRSQKDERQSQSVMINSLVRFPACFHCAWVITGRMTNDKVNSTYKKKILWIHFINLSIVNSMYVAVMNLVVIVTWFCQLKCINQYVINEIDFRENSREMIIPIWCHLITSVKESSIKKV